MDTTPRERTALLATELAAHSAYLLRVACSRVRDDYLAHEAVQDTLVAALECAHSFDGRAKLRTWLTGILLHKIHDGFRRSAQRSKVEVECGDLDEGDSRLAVEWSTPEDALHFKQLRGAFSRALAKLPARQAEAFLLRELSGLDTAALSRTMGVSANNAWVLLHRARARLGAALASEGFS